MAKPAEAAAPAPKKAATLTSQFLGKADAAGARSELASANAQLDSKIPSNALGDSAEDKADEAAAEKEVGGCCATYYSAAQDAKKAKGDDVTMMDTVNSFLVKLLPHISRTTRMT